MKKQKQLKILWDYFLIFVGSFVYALAFNCFFEANHFAMGGFTGVSQIIHRLIPAIPVGTAVLVLNIPFLIMGVKKQGIKLLIATLFAIIVSSLMIDGMAAIYTFPPMDKLLACIYGSVLMGISLGIMMQKNATTGGTELVARMLKYKFRHLSIGRLCLTVDVAVVVVYALVFREWTNAMYGMIAMYICSKVMDIVIYGSVNAKLALIVSTHSEEITKRLLNKDLGVTLLDGKGAWTGNRKDIILCVFKKPMIAQIKTIATEEDPNAFVIVCEAHEVLGEGFGEYTEDSL